jgi:uncharacterized protein YdeI (YjbR/CyaY-like superfamily)
MKTVECKTRAEWRAWLAENHERENEIWLVYYKKATGIPCIAYGDSLDEALCYGWVDSLIKKIDEEKYDASSPRGKTKASGRWSIRNGSRS